MIKMFSNGCTWLEFISCHLEAMTLEGNFRAKASLKFIVDLLLRKRNWISATPLLSKVEQAAFFHRILSHWLVAQSAFYTILLLNGITFAYFRIKEVESIT